MKIESASQFRRLLKRGLTKVFNDDSWPSNEQSETERGLIGLNENLNEIADIYNSLETDEAKKTFKEHFIRSIKAHVMMWEDNQEGDK